MLRKLREKQGKTVIHVSPKNWGKVLEPLVEIMSTAIHFVE